MTSPVDVVVAIPARNEQHLVRRCLESVKTSADQAVQSGVTRRILIAVAAHRCTDRPLRKYSTALLATEVPSS